MIECDFVNMGCSTKVLRKGINENIHLAFKIICI